MKWLAKAYVCMLLTNSIRFAVENAICLLFFFWTLYIRSFSYAKKEIIAMSNVTCNKINFYPNDNIVSFTLQFHKILQKRKYV